MAKKSPRDLETFDAALRQTVAGLMNPVNMLAEIVAQKLQEQGIDTAAHTESIKRGVEKLLASENIAKQSKIEIESLGERDDEPSINIEKTDLDAAFEAASAAIQSATPEFLEDLAKRALKEVLSQPLDRLNYLEIERDSFNVRLAHTWRKPLQLLDIHIALCFELGAAGNGRLRRLSRRAKDAPLVDVLSRLHARACQVAGEVRVLMHNGYADGALSRWRTLHEIAVTALFIGQHGPDTAVRYMHHLDADSVKAAKQFQRMAPLLGYAPLTAAELRGLAETEQLLRDRYGREFLSDYGWAGAALGKPVPNFADVEGAVNLDHLRLEFRLASNAVHAGAKGTYFRVGQLGEVSVLLAGSSNVGLDEPGRLCAHSLAQATSALLAVRGNADSVVWTKVALALSRKIGKSLERVRRQIEREEAEIVRARSSPRKR